MECQLLCYVLKGKQVQVLRVWFTADTKLSGSTEFYLLLQSLRPGTCLVLSASSLYRLLVTIPAS